MNDSIEFMNTEGIKFFGTVNASISHELKNILAIISETAGFLKDLTDLAKQGKELKLSQLEGCSNSITEDIQRGFLTIKQMNRFAHSVDHSVKEIDMKETVELMIGLSGFLSFASKVIIEKSDVKEYFILTSPFLMQNLIYQTLFSFYKAVGPNGETRIMMESQPQKGVRLVFSASAEISPSELNTEKFMKTARVLGVEAGLNSTCNEMELNIPYASQSIVDLKNKLKI